MTATCRSSLVVHNLREQDTIEMMGAVVLGMDGKRLKYDELIRDNGLDSGARG